MTSTQGNKKSNEYKLDLLPSPLFSVDFLDSQISANNVSAGRRRRENSHMIQITSLDNSIWRGEVWSKISFKIKVDKTFLRCPRKGVPFTLHPAIEDINTRVIYESGCDKVKLRFARNTAIGCDGSKALVTLDPYNSLEADIHKDLVGSGGAFTLVIDARREDHYENEETIFGRSQKIYVTSYSLSIEQRFLDNQFVSSTNDTDFAWYSKCGGENAGLKVIFHLKDDKGRIVNPCLTPLDLNTELLYADGSATPFMPLSPLKERKSSRASKNPLYRPIEPDPVLAPSTASRPFSFRIEEVSFHHPGQAGFKLKVSVCPSNSFCVHPGILQETIVVLSKPKHDKSNQKKRQNPTITSYEGPAFRSSALSGNIESCGGRVEQPKKRNRRVSYSNVDMNHSSGTMATISVSAVAKAIYTGGKCVLCDKKIERGSVYRPNAHSTSCLFVKNIIYSIKAPPTALPAKREAAGKGAGSEEASLVPLFTHNAEVSEFNHSHPSSNFGVLPTSTDAKICPPLASIVTLSHIFPDEIPRSPHQKIQAISFDEPMSPNSEDITNDIISWNNAYMKYDAKTPYPTTPIFFDDITEDSIIQSAVASNTAGCNVPSQRSPTTETRNGLFLIESEHNTSCNQTTCPDASTVNHCEIECSFTSPRDINQMLLDMVDIPLICNMKSDILGDDLIEAPMSIFDDENEIIWQDQDLEPLNFKIEEDVFDVQNVRV